MAPTRREFLAMLALAPVLNVQGVFALDPADTRPGIFTRAAVTAEGHSAMGGLGSSVVAALRRRPIPVEFVGIEDSFETSVSNHEELLQHYGLTVEAIVEKAGNLELRDLA